MATSNAAVSALLRQYAATLSLEGADRFKIKAYRRAAETVDTLDADIADLVLRGEDLKKLPGVGKALSRTIEEIVRTGKMAPLDKSMSQLGPEVVEIATRPRLDPKKVLRIYKKLQIGNLAELRVRLESGKIGEVFGRRLEYHVRQGLDERPRSLLYNVRDQVEKITDFLNAMPGVVQVAPTGSLRRKQETVGDLNFLISGKSAATIFRNFSRFGGVRVVEGQPKGLFKLSDDFAIALTWTPPKEWGLRWLLSTGSQAHLEDLTRRADAIGLELTAEGCRDKGIDPATEAAVYRGLGLAFIEPELREGRGEVAAARRKRLPHLMQIGDLKGDLHMHTTASDGANSMAEMAAAARERGYEYIAITDHSQSLKITNGLSEARLRQQIRNIDKLNGRLKGITILKSAEVDILEDGTLDYSDSLLRELDFTVCSIHSRFGLNGQQQTSRILRAMDNPYFTIMGHPTGRLLLRREGYELDMEKVLQHAAERNSFFEINSSPDRLDLSDQHAKRAKELGIKIAIDSDAHSTHELEFVSAGVNQARRAWLEPRDVLNTLPLRELQKLFARSRG